MILPLAAIFPLAAVMSAALPTKVAIFGCVALVAWFALEFFASGGSRAEERLGEMNDPRSRQGDLLGSGKQGSMMSRLLEKASPKLSQPFQPKKAEDKIKLPRQAQSCGLSHRIGT